MAPSRCCVLASSKDGAGETEHRSHMQSDLINSAAHKTACLSSSDLCL